MLTTRAGVGLTGAHCAQPCEASPAATQALQTCRPAAQRMPSTMSATSAPHLPATRTGSTRPSQLIPATPLLLLVTAATIPAMSVPCQELYWRVQPLNTVGAASLSAWLTQSPGSAGSA